MDESVQRELERTLDPAVLEKLLRADKPPEPRYAWRSWEGKFCLGCLVSQPLGFKEVLRRHGFWETGIAIENFKPDGRPFPLDRGDA
jgi:hypothetical protein